MDRSLGMGGSDIGCLFGHGFKTKVEMYLEKAEGFDFYTDEGMRFGTRVERMVFEDYLTLTYSQEVGDGDFLVRAADVPSWVVVHPDFCAIRDDEMRGVEVKTVDPYEARGFGEAGTDHVPPSYQMQCQWYMYAFGAEWWDLAAQIGFRELRIFHLRRNNRLIAILKEAARHFWFDHIVPRIPPPPGTSWEASRVYVQPERGVVKIATPEIEQRVYNHRFAKDCCKMYEQQIDDEELEIKNFMGDDAELLHDSASRLLLSWKMGKKSRSFLNKLKSDGD